MKKQESSSVETYNTIHYNPSYNEDITTAWFVDYQKAYDTIHRQIVSNKLELYGVRCPVLKLLKSFFYKNRKYSTGINKSFSTEVTSFIVYPSH